MALRTTNISALFVGETFDSRTTQIGASCVVPNINKWSKFKPVRGIWPASVNGKYGLDLTNNWAYLSPRGAPEDEPLRIGDFRGYEHDHRLTLPPVRCLTTECTIRTIYPVGNTNYYNLWKVRFYKDASNVVFTPADMGLEGYYYGLKITAGGTSYYRTFGPVATVGSEGKQFIVDATLANPSVPQYNNLPYGTGTYLWKLILCSEQVPAWTSIQPIIVYDFPSEILPDYTIFNSGSFTVANWIAASDVSHSFNDSAPGSASSGITFASGGVFTISNPISSWCEIEVWDEDMFIEKTAYPAQWYSGRILLFKPTTNYSSARSGTVTVSANGASVAIAVQQAGVWVAPIVSAFIPDSGWSVVNTGWSFNVSLSQVTVFFTPSGLSGTPVTIYIAAYRLGVERVEISTSARDGYQTTRTLNLGEVIPTGAQYKIYISTTPNSGPI